MHEWTYWLLAVFISNLFTYRVVLKAPPNFHGIPYLLLIIFYWVAFLAFGLGRLASGNF